MPGGVGNAGHVNSNTPSSPLPISFECFDLSSSLAPDLMLFCRSI